MMARYYHGGRAALAPGQLIKPGQRPNPWGDTFDSRGRSLYVYCTTDRGTAESYATAVRKTGRRAHVYEVRPTGQLLPDGSSRDFKSSAPLEVVRRVN
jgi:hypothetical protein